MPSPRVTRASVPARPDGLEALINYRSLTEHGRSDAFGQVKLTELRQTLRPHIDDRPPGFPDFASSRAEHSHRSAEAIRFEFLELLQGGDPAEREIP
jgi:hypothetical protein